MAIASFLVQVEPGRMDAARRALAGRPGLDVEDAGDARHLVVVAEAPAESLPGMERELKGVPGVLAVLTAFVNVEDELPGDWSGPRGDVLTYGADVVPRISAGCPPREGGEALRVEGGSRPQSPGDAVPAGACPHASGAA